MKKVIKAVNVIMFSYAAVLAAAGFYGQESRLPVYGGWVLCIVLCCWFVREKSRRQVSFFCGHLALAAMGTGVVEGLGLPMGFLVVMGALMTVSILVRLIPGAEIIEVPGSFHLTFLAVFFWSSRYGGGDGAAADVIFLVFLATLLLKVFYGNLVYVEVFIRGQETSTKFDKAKLKKLNLRLTLLYTAGLGLVLALAGMIHTGNLAKKLFGWIREFISRLLQKIPSSFEQGNGENRVQNFALLPSGEISVFWEVIFFLVKSFLLIGFVILAIWLIAGFLASVSRSFYNYKEKADGVEETAESLMRTEKLHREKHRRFGGTERRKPADKIRRLYKKNVRKYWRKQERKIRYTNPAEQIAQIWRQTSLTKEDAEEIQRLYEEARYCQGKPTEDEAAQMQKLFQNAAPYSGHTENESNF